MTRSPRKTAGMLVDRRSQHRPNRHPAEAPLEMLPPIIGWVARVVYARSGDRGRTGPRNPPSDAGSTAVLDERMHARQ